MSLALPIELLIKSGAIAALGLTGAALMAGAAARDRADVLRATVCMLIATPLLIAFAPGLTLNWLPPVHASTAPVWTGELGPVAGVTVTASIPEIPAQLWLAGAYGLGVTVVLARFAIGVWTLNRWTLAGQPVKSTDWISALARLAPNRHPRLVVSHRVGGPLSWGFPPGAILIAPGQVERGESATAVLAHEMAHLRRGDWVFLALSRIALALFWFNPLVWRVHARLAEVSEEAADAAAVAAVDPAAYARTLVGLAADTSNIAAVRMAGSPKTLKRRIALIMSARNAHRARPLTLLLAVAGLVLVATPLAAVELQTQERRLPAAPEAPPAPPAPPAAPSWAPPAPQAPAAPVAPVSRVAPPVPPAPPAPPAPQVLQISGGYAYSRPATPEELRQAEGARRQAAQARAEAGEARRQAAQARAGAEAARAEGARARAEGDAARARAVVAREEAARARAQGRVEMARGAEEMARGAAEMRAESDRLRDPAYRAEQIARSRREGHEVTDAELVALLPRLASQAEDLDRQAARLRRQAEEMR